MLKSIKRALLHIRSRRWGLQLLLRLSVSERDCVRKFIVFCVGIILSIRWVDSYVSDIKAFIEFRTDIMKGVDFTGFDNINGVNNKVIIPNYIHYIRLNQSEIR